jgi:hypothetical protein
MKNGMEDSMKYWSKSALSVYRYLEQMSNTIDKLVKVVEKDSYLKQRVYESNERILTLKNKYLK